MKRIPKLGVSVTLWPIFGSPICLNLLWIAALFTEVAQAQCVVAFGEAGAAFIQHQGAVKESRRGQTERAVEQELAGGGNEQVGTAHDFGDLHRGVIGDAGELVGGHVVVTPDNEIAEVASGDELLRAKIAVGEGDGFAIGNAEAPAELG